MANNKSGKKSFLDSFNDPKKGGMTALAIAGVSFFIFGQGLSLMAIIYGVFGLYTAIKNKAGGAAILLNLAAIVLGIISRVLLEVFVK